MKSSFVVNVITYTCHNLNDRLTHWGWDKMAAILQTTFLNAFSWMEIHDLRNFIEFCPEESK